MFVLLFCFLFSPFSPPIIFSALGNTLVCDKASVLRVRYLPLPAAREDAITEAPDALSYLIQQTVRKQALVPAGLHEKGVGMHWTNLVPDPRKPGVCWKSNVCAGILLFLRTSCKCGRSSA